MLSKRPRARICVFCSTKSGNDPSGPAAAIDLAQSLHKHNVQLIYGGGTTGLMGELASERTRLGGMGSVIGVIPYALVDRERNIDGKLSTKTKLSRMVSVLGLRNIPRITEREDLGDDVHDLPPDPNYGRVVGVSSLGRRKAVMMNLVNNGGVGSGFIALPGALGSLDEILEVLTHRQMGVHRYPILLVNVGGFWDGIKTWVDNAYDKGFLNADSKKFIRIVDTPEEAVELLLAYKPPRF